MTAAAATDGRRVCVFCGASAGARPEYVAQAAALGQGLARAGIEVVFGGGAVGLMGAVADAALAAGGRVTGVIPESLMAAEIAHAGVTDLRVTRSMHERKALMADLADGFVALPGGFGTFDELFEIVTWAQLGLHRKPIVLLDAAGYWDTLYALAERAVAEGFVRPEHGALLVSAASVDEALAAVATAARRPPPPPRWAERVRR